MAQIWNGFATALFVVLFYSVACQEEWEISQSRSPRAVLNFLPYTYIVSLLQAAQNCCDAPVLIPNYVQSQCGATATTRRYGGYRYRSRGRGFGGLFGTLVNGYGYQGRISNNGAAFTEQVLLNVCYADCAYQGLGLVNQSTFSSSASLNMDQISTLFSNATDYYPDWSDVVSNATDYCSSKASTSPRAIRTFSGRICSTYPLKFSICVRRYLLQNCLSDNTTQGTYLTRVILHGRVHENSRLTTLPARIRQHAIKCFSHANFRQPV
ncbi:uncharacterized protein LOC135940699 isoform X1 [Cloeon dipterum]|uniref:uncharacterized protein LOC135940699 isoform X1 n=1 Tax=Cloeon dipterum TaxID=197152 RepID=UPI00321FCCF0